MNEQYTQAPHHSERSSAPSPNAALLIDFDNVTMGIRSNLGQELRQLLNSDIIRGKVSVQRAYADWRRYPQYVVPLSEAAIDLIYAPAYGSSKKNATDIRLAIDALELVFTRPEIGTFILLSGDSDFSSLVLKLKEYGKYVIGVGMQESSSDLLVQNCDEYYSYDSLSGLVTADEMDTERHDPWELTEHSIKKMVERNDVMRSDRLKQVMLELDPSFDEKEIGYSKFNRFLTEASSRGILRLQKIGNGQYEVGPGSSVDAEAPAGDGGGPTREEDGAAPPPRDLTGESADDEAGAGAATSGEPSGRREESGDVPAEEEKETRAAGTGRTGGGAGGDRPVVEAEQLRAGYDLLQEVVADLSGDDGRVRDSEVKREMLNRDSSFDEGALGFSKFSRFIRQAHDEEVVDITKDDDGNYYLETGEDEPRSAPSREAGTEPGGTERDESPEETREGRPGRTEREAGPTDGEPADEEPAAATSEPAAEKAEKKEASADDRPSEAERGGGLRRRRRSEGRESSSSDSDDGSWVPGPVDAGGDGGGSSSSPTAADGPSEAERGGSGDGGGSGDSSSSTAGRRGVGRFRRGRKSGEGSEKADEDDAGDAPAPGPVSSGSERDEEVGSGGDGGSAPAGDGGASRQGGRTGADREEAEEAPATAGRPTSADASTAPAAAGEPPDGAEEIVRHMKDRYSGVGEKTARKLVEEFGEDTLDVIDDDPGRVRGVLPKHRAEAVLQARAVEREKGDGAGGGRD